MPFNTALAGEIFSTGFESGSMSPGEKLQNGFSWGDMTNTQISTAQSKTGSHSLQFRFKSDTDPTNNSRPDAFAEQRFNLGGLYPDIWIKYDLYIPSNYYHRTTGGNNNKSFVWLWTGNYGQPREGPKIGGHFWPTGSVGNSQVALFGGARINGEPSLNLNWNCPECGDGKSNSAIVVNDRGHWMTLVIHIKYATEANYLAALAADGSYDFGDGDGVAEVWKTDWQGVTEKLIDVHDGHWYSTQINSTEPARGFDTGYLLGWASSGFDEKTILHIDNITFSTTPLSNDFVSNYLAAPKPPFIIVN